MLTRSTPALPLLRLTAAKASCINFRLIRPVNEWCLIWSGPTMVRLSGLSRAFDSPESPCRTCRGECFLTALRPPERGPGHSDKALRLGGLTVLMVRRRGVSFRWVSLSRPSPLLRESCRPQGETVRVGLFHAAASARRFGWALSAGITRPAAWVGRDDVGLSPVSVVSHCVQAMPPTTPAVRPSYPSTDGRGCLSRASASVGAWPPNRGRIATPPAPSSPGPFTAACCQTTLAA